MSGSEGSKSYRIPITLRFDLIPPVALRRVAATYEEGAKVYGEATYIERRLPFSVVINHMLNHLTLYETGDRSEDHLAKIAWAALTLITLEEVYGGTDEAEAVIDVSEFGARGTARKMESRK